MKKFLLFLFLSAMFAFSGCVQLETSQKCVVIDAATFNVRVPRDKAPNDWKNRGPRLKKFLQEQQIGIFGVQEAVMIQLKDIETLGYRWVGLGRSVTKEGEYSAIVYDPERFECITWETFWLSDTPDVPGSRSWGNSLPRICTVGKFRDKATRKLFIFANTHLDHKCHPANTKAAELIIKRVNLSDDIPFILTGDFNSRRGSDVINRFSSVLKDAGIIAETKLAGPLNTFHGYHPEKIIRRSPIDFIFVNGSVKVKTFQVVNDCKNGLYASDHFMVKARLSF